MTKHEVTHCKNCIAGHYTDVNEVESYYCNHPKMQQIVLRSLHSDSVGVDDKELPDICPLHSEPITAELDKDVPKPYNPDAEFDRLCNDSDTYIKSRKE